jgi:hypothetical protein
MTAVSSELQLLLWVPVALDNERPKALMSSPNPRTVLHPARLQTRRSAVSTTRVFLMGERINENAWRCRLCGFAKSGARGGAGGDRCRALP